MRCIGYSFFLFALLGVQTAASAQDARFTPPRLRITTKSDKDAPTTGVTVSGVSPTGLGDKLGLKPGDVIQKIKIVEGDKQKEWPIDSPKKLADCLTIIRDVTIRNDKRTAAVTFELKNAGKHRTIAGDIIRAEIPDRIDGGTLYYFRSASKDDPRGTGRQTNPGKAP